MSALDPKPFTELEMIELAQEAVGMIDARGKRGIERLTHDHITAMALTLACLGLKPTPYKGSPQ
ncbi:MAG: hypothetical protein ACJAYH_001086 [Celeribacter sp.]|jgi:hypothetical protein